MGVREATLGELVAAARDGWRNTSWCDPVAPHVVLVDLRDQPVPPPPLAVRAAPAIVVGVTPGPDVAGLRASEWCDVVIADGDGALRSIVATVEAAPLASAAFVQVLRGAGGRGLADGLLLESAVYSTLQGGPELAAWLAARTRRARPPEPAHLVRIERHDAVLRLVLDRPHVRNALNAALRDELLAAFDLARWDDSIRSIELSGAGVCFSSGGDLDEFGSYGDPTTAHLVRGHASLAVAFHELRDRMVVRVHGSCRGSGIELPAFAGRVVATGDATFGLPELRLGLVPGAGGTVSLPARIGRHRTALLGLTGAPVDAATALTWGLVDEVVSATG